MRAAAILPCLVLATFVPGVALADVEAIRAEDNSVWLAAGASHLNYSEFADGGDNIDTERGWLPSIAGGFSMLGGQPGSVFPRNLYLALDFSADFGDLRYNGGLLDGTPYNGSTDETIWTVRGRAGYAFQLGTQALLIPFAQLGYRAWDRELSDVQNEEYRNIDVTGGLLAQYAPTPKTVLSLWGAVGETVAGEMTAHTLGNRMDFDLGDKITWTAGVKAGYWFWPHIELFTRISYDRLSYGRSQDVATSIPGLFFYEPNSDTDTITSQFGIAYNFQ